MKRLPVILLAATLALVTMVTGCGGAHRYDSRLTAADALMHDNPDSAMAIIGAVNPQSLNSQADRAFHALLLTQARYRCYIVATSDSDINRALDYYRAHPREREKLTRAHLYKGAVMEELGCPDSAMFHYKSAEAIADNSDYFILGQINTRIGSLYRKYYGDEIICYDKYKNALYYYRLIKDKQLQMNCLYNMANSSSVTNRETALNHYKQAISLALELNDSSNTYMCMERMCRHLYSKDSTREEAKLVALECLDNFRDYINSDLFIDLAFIYVQDKKPDSARFYLQAAEPVNNRNAQLQMRYFWALSDIYRAEGDTTLSNYYNRLKSQISDSIDNNYNKSLIQHIENANNSKRAISKQLEIDNLKLFLWLSLLLSLALLLLGIYYLYHRRCKYIQLIKELENTHVDNHESLLREIEQKNSMIGHFVQTLTSFMQTSINTSENDSPSVIRRKIKDTIATVANDDFWNELRAHLNRKHNNLISKISENKKINEKDLQFIELLCCGFNYVEIAITTGYSIKYISTKRKNIARKLGLRCSLQDFIDNAIKESPQN